LTVKMCQCFFRFLKCIAITINVILFIAGLGLIAGGIYGKTQLDVREVLGKEYKNNVPGIDQFVGNDHKDPNTAKLTEKADKFVEKSLDEIADIADKAFIAFIGIGAVMSCIALWGILAFTCCNKKRCCVIIFMVLMIILAIPFIALCVIAADEYLLRGLIFDKLDKLALEKKFTNRFFMAAIQSQLKCCGVRGNVDYYCNGIYDFVCNPGCKTYDKIWEEMKKLVEGKGFPPMCTKSDKFNPCKKLAAVGKEDKCNKNFNVPKPVDGKGTAYCKNYQDKYKTEEDSISANKYKVMKKNLLDKDPATGSTGDPSVHGSLLQEATVTKGKQGCGFAIWEKVDMDNFLNIAVIAFGIISLIILFQIVVAVMSLFCNKKNNKNKSRKSKSSSSSSS